MNHTARWALVWAASGLLGWSAGVASAQTLPDFVNALPLPLPNDAWVWAGSPPGDTGRLFVMEGGGTIRILDIAYPQGAYPVYTLRPTPFLVNASTQARSVEFAPDYATTGKFYVAHEATGGSRITEFTVSPDPNIADPASARIIRAFANLQFDHALGSMHFWRDGLLYIGCGDAMSSNNGQLINTVHGKLLRIDVKSGDDFPEDANRNYRIPVGNPLVGREGAMPEIWHIGIRNPWRWSFDRWNGDLWMAEVLGGLPGEINHLTGVGTPYMNFGWPAREGNSGTSTNINPDFTAETLTYPVLAIDRTGNQCSTSGGAMYRGNDVRPWRGRYIWGDYCSARIYSARFDGAALLDTQDHTPELSDANTGAAIAFNSISMIAEDGAGELYILRANRGTSSGGGVYRIVAAGPQPPIADVGVAGGLPGADGAFDNNDFIAFIDFFFANNPRADMGKAGGLRGADQLLDNNDFIAFIDAFFLGQ